MWGEAKLPERLGELDLQISAEAFFQTNTEMAERLYEIVAEYAALEGWERVYDLYSGIGTIALTLAPRAGELWGIELIEEAVADAIAGARANAITKANFFAGDARLALPELLTRAGRPDVLVVDPPRAGLSKKVVHRIIDCSPSASCTSPATRRRSRRMRPNSSTPAGSCARSAPSTCSPRRTTSSASPCSSGTRAGARGVLGARGRPPAPCDRSARPATLRRLPRHPDARGIGFSDARRDDPRRGDPDRGAPRPAAGAGEVLVRVRAAGLNGADMMQRRGLYPAPPGWPQDIPGMELAGEVAALGPGAERFAVGDRVMAIVGGGAQAELCVVHERR